MATPRWTRVPLVLDRRGERNLRLRRLRYASVQRLRVGRAPFVERVSAGLPCTEPPSLRIRCLRPRHAPPRRPRMGARPLRAFPALFLAHRCAGALARACIRDRRVLARLGPPRPVQPHRHDRMARRIALFRRHADPQLHRARRRERPLVLAADLPAHWPPAHAAWRDVGAPAAAVPPVIPSAARTRARHNGGGGGALPRPARGERRSSRPRHRVGAPAHRLVLPGLPRLRRRLFARRALGCRRQASRCCCSRCRICRPAREHGGPPPRSSIPANCNGCARCFADCPYAAVTMHVAHGRQAASAPGRRRSGPVRGLRHLCGRMSVVDAISIATGSRDRHRHAGSPNACTSGEARGGAATDRRAMRRRAMCGLASWCSAASRSTVAST